MAHDVFLSYATQDKPTADAVCARLEQHGIRCWIAPRDILPGRDWRTSIVEAIGSARALVLMLSAQANSSSEVPKEILQATQRSLPIITFRIEDVTPSGPLSYELNSIHWLDALTKPLERHIDTLAGTLQKVLNVEPAAPVPSQIRQPARGRSAVTLIAAVALTVLVTAAATWWFVGRSGTTQVQTPASNGTSTQPVKPAESPTQPPVATNQSGGRLAGQGQAAPASIQNQIQSAPRRRQAPRADTPPPSDPAPAAPPTQPVSAAVTSPAPDPLPATTTSSQSQHTPAVVGCWSVAGQPGIVVVRPDGTFVSGGVIKGSWITVNPATSTYQLQFPDDVAYGEMSADGRRLTNSAAPNEPLSRVSGGPDLSGVWRYPNGLTISIESNGTAKIGSLTGRWKATDTGRRLYEFRWPGRPMVTISGDAMKYVDIERGVTVDLRRLPCGDSADGL